MGFDGHNQIDFYEWGGIWNFWINRDSEPTTDLDNLCLRISPTWVQNKRNIFTWPTKSGTLALTDDLPTQATSTQLGLVKSSTTGTAANRDYNVLKSFVTNSQKPVDTYSFNKINVSEYIKLLNSKELTYIYMCSDTSCKEQNRILDDISKTRKFKVNYLNLDEVTTVGDWELLNNSDKIFEDTWFVPVNIVVKNGKIKSYKMEVLDENGLIEFLEDNGMW